MCVTPHTFPSSNQFNSMLQILWSILFLLTLKESIVNSSQLFMSPFFADPVRNWPFRLSNNCDCYTFCAAPHQFWICIWNAVISFGLCLSITENHTSPFFPLSIWFIQVKWQGLQNISAIRVCWLELLLSVDMYVIWHGPALSRPGTSV